MVVKEIIGLIFALCLFNSDVTGHGHFKVQYLSSYEEIIINYVGSRDLNLTTTKYLAFEAYGKKFKIDLSIYYPLSSNAKLQTFTAGSMSDVAANVSALYQGKVRGIKDSFVLGYLQHKGNFRGYVVTDQVYCIESDQEMPGMAIMYRFQDVIPPGCTNATVKDCSNTTFFEPWIKAKGQSKKYSSENLAAELNVLGMEKVEHEIADVEIISQEQHFTVEKLDNQVDDKSCSLEIIASLSLLKKFRGYAEELMKDIFLQIEMLNILYRKIQLKTEKQICHLYFNIDSIYTPTRELFIDPLFKLTIDDLISRYGDKKPSCITLGLDMTLDESTDFFDRYKLAEGEGACSKYKDTVIITYGTEEKMSAMPLYFASYFRSITRALGVTDNNSNCRKGSIPNPIMQIEKYIRAKEITPDESYGLFSKCNVQEIEKTLDGKDCLKPFNHTNCGNAIVDIGEECDCGPKEFCDDVDKCCNPPEPVFSEQTAKDANTKACTFREAVQCSDKSACCEDCKIPKKGTKCVDEVNNCAGECNGNSSDCTCIKNASVSKYPCIGLECSTIQCVSGGLKPCVCLDENECLVCCEKDRICKTATYYWKLEGDKLLKFPDGALCGNFGICMNGTCTNEKDSLTVPRKGRLAGPHEDEDHKKSHSSDSHGESVDSSVTGKSNIVRPAYFCSFTIILILMFQMIYSPNK